MNENGTTYIIKTILKCLLNNKEEIKSFYKYYPDHYDSYLFWYEDCKNYLNITNDEQRQFCNKIEEILKEINEAIK
jgi:hypothetical protein